MKRKEAKALSITQSNDASCNGPGTLSARARKKLKRTSSKIVRQALDKEDRDGQTL